jgi:hypothetical protein
MQKLIITTIFTILFSQTLLANDFGTYTERAKNHIKEERIKAIVSSSISERAAVETSRDIASFSPQDEAWANEYETLMKDDSARDYLQESMDL